MHPIIGEPGNVMYNRKDKVSMQGQKPGQIDALSVCITIIMQLMCEYSFESSYGKRKRCLKRY